MKLLTEISETLNLPFVDLIKDESTRHSSFAKQHHPENIFEAGARGRNKTMLDGEIIIGPLMGTIGTTPIKDSQITTVHTDDDNCESRGYEWQILASEVSIYEDRDGIIVDHDFVAGYGCQACRDYIVRENQAESLSDMVREYQAAHDDPSLSTICRETFEQKLLETETFSQRPRQL